jgi:type I restriction enzyme S subunit
LSLAEPRPIKDYCIGIYDGPHATPGESDDGPVFLGVKNLTEEGRLDLSEIRHVSDDDFPRWTRRVTPQAGDVVFTYEASLHRYALIPDSFEGCLGRRVALVRPDPGQVDSRYLLYFFLSYAWRSTMESNVMTGATVDRIPLERFPDFPVALPPVGTQERVADVLAAYDALVENNRRRIALLDQAANELSREWFVRLRFPGHEHTPVVDGIPQGWEQRPLGDCVRFRSGGTPSKQRTDYWEGDLPWVSSGEMTATRIYDTSLHLSNQGAQNGSTVVPAGTLLIVVRGMSLAKECRVAVAARSLTFNQDIKALTCKPGIDPSFLAYSLLAARPFIKELATEASHGTKKLDTPALERLPILVPPASLQASFREVVEQLDALRDTLHAHAEKLKVARTLLLPQLLSGEVAP